VQLTADTALTQARQADAALARGENKGPMHGVPITVKDSFDTEGVISTAGTKGRASYVPQQDATAVARMLAAGAILLGKTNLPELSLAYESNNLIYGRTNNPYDLSRTPGGSSGGESAIIAAGGSPMGLVAFVSPPISAVSQVSSPRRGASPLPAFCHMVLVHPLDYATLVQWPGSWKT
jgi:amidase